MLDSRELPLAMWNASFFLTAVSLGGLGRAMLLWQFLDFCPTAQSSTTFRLLVEGKPASIRRLTADGPDHPTLQRAVLGLANNGAASVRESRSQAH